MMRLFDFQSTQLDSRVRGNDGIFCNIVTIWPDLADKEIEVLQQKRDCLKQEKKTLMQQLLTGKRRVKVEAVSFSQPPSFPRTRESRRLPDMAKGKNQHVGKHPDG